jgi:hypothetical protein
MKLNTRYCRSVFVLLPEELQDHIWGYVVNHHKNYGVVMNEMISNLITDVCDNYTCHGYINCNTCVEGEIMDVVYNYCSDYCQEYDIWLHKYHYKRWNNGGVSIPQTPNAT